MKNLQLKRGKEESLLRFHPWVFSGAIQSADEGLEDGDLVHVLNHEGRFIAVGHYQKGSIAVRVLSFRDVPIDGEFWYSRLSSALNMRISIGLADNPNNNTYRLVHGEGDNLPGLVIDIYGKTAVKNGFIIGGGGDNTAVENGLMFYVDWLRGQKTGFFVDQRENRSLLEKFAKGRKVLNMFCYTGGFSFYAMRGGAALVHSVDSSAKAIELTNRNVQLNFPSDVRHQAFCEDAFKYLEGTDNQYDLIILDPPAFAKHRGALHNALKGYTRLNNKAFQMIQPGGILFTFSCSQVVTKDHFRNAVFTAAAQAGRKVRILHQLHQPADHPINIYHPEGEYLKGLVLYVE